MGRGHALGASLSRPRQARKQAEMTILFHGVGEHNSYYNCTIQFIDSARKAPFGFLEFKVQNRCVSTATICAGLSDAA
jgi:hypothetical protein